MKPYIVVEANSAEHLAYRVNEELKRGYAPHGSMSTLGGDTWTLYSQPMMLTPASQLDNLARIEQELQAVANMNARVMCALEGSQIPPGYQYGRDATENFDFGVRVATNRAAAAMLELTTIRPDIDVNLKLMNFGTRRSAKEVRAYWEQGFLFQFVQPEDQQGKAASKHSFRKHRGAVRLYYEDESGRAKWTTVR